MGSTTSNMSSHFRTGAGTPLVGVNVTAHTVDHASVRLSWTLPSIRLLRGPAIRFDISYEIVGGAVFIWKSLPGNETNVTVGGLRPSTRYAFKVWSFAIQFLYNY